MLIMLCISHNLWYNWYYDMWNIFHEFYTSIAYMSIGDYVIF
jgi:hypothetical protein